MATCAILTCNKLAAQILTLGWRRSRFERVCGCVTRGLGVWVKLCRGETTESEALWVYSKKIGSNFTNTGQNGLFVKGGRKDIELTAWANSSNLWNNKVLWHQGVNWLIYRNTVYACSDWTILNDAHKWWNSSNDVTLDSNIVLFDGGAKYIYHQPSLYCVWWSIYTEDYIITGLRALFCGEHDSSSKNHFFLYATSNINNIKGNLGGGNWT